MSLRKIALNQEDKSRLIAVAILGAIIVTVVGSMLIPTMPEDEMEYALQVRLVSLDDESLPSVIEMRDVNGSLLERMIVVRGPEEAFSRASPVLRYTLSSLEGVTIDTGDHLITLSAIDFKFSEGTGDFGDTMSAKYEFDDYIVYVILWEAE